MTPPTKLPAFQFYVGDWRKDVGVQGLDFEHRGVWIELLCIMHESPERGRLVLPSGDALPDDAIARNLAIPEAEWKQKRSKLLAYGVASEDDRGVLYNRRMVRDEDIRQKRAAAGAKGGKVSKPPSKTEANGGSSVSSSPSGKEKASPKRKRWRFCPDGWQPNDGHRKLAAELGVDLASAGAAFRDHEFDKPRSDPDRTFNNWLRNQARFGPSRNGKSEMVKLPSGRVVTREEADELRIQALGY